MVHRYRRCGVVANIISDRCFFWENYLQRYPHFIEEGRGCVWMGLKEATWITKMGCILDESEGMLTVVLKRLHPSPPVA